MGYYDKNSYFYVPPLNHSPRYSNDIFSNFKRNTTTVSPVRTRTRMPTRQPQRIAQRRKYKGSGSKTKTNYTPRTSTFRKLKKIYNTVGTLKKSPKALPFKDKQLFEKYGSIIRLENRGVQTDPHCVYIGHSNMPTRTVVQGVIRALLKNLAKQMGCDIQDYRGSLFDTGFSADIIFRYTYYDSIQSTTINSVDVSYTSGQDWLTLTNNIYASWISTFDTTTVHQLIKCTFVQEVATTPLVHQTLATIYANQFTLDFKLFSNITVQNRTLASTDTNLDADNKNNVSNNPLRSRMYEQNNTNALVPRLRSPATDASYVALLADFDSGIITTNATDSNPNEYIKPPKATFFSGKILTNSLTINPGQIIKHNLNSRFKQTLTTFFNRFAYQVAIDANQHIKLGKTCVYAMEKVLDVGSESSSISVGYEVNQICSIKGYYQTAVPSVPLNFISAV